MDEIKVIEREWDDEFGQMIYEVRAYSADGWRAYSRQVFKHAHLGWPPERRTARAEVVAMAETYPTDTKHNPQNDEKAARCVRGKADAKISN